MESMALHIGRSCTKTLLFLLVKRKVITYDERSSFEGVEVVNFENFVFSLEKDKESGR